MKYSLALLLCILLFFSSCAHYNATTLCTIEPDHMYETNGISVGAKAYTKAECCRYLDRNVIRKGYQPIQICIENGSESAYLFSTDRVSVPVARAEEVSKKMHTSTVGRIAGYGAAALLASPLFAIPAVVDGFKSAEANNILDYDFQQKAAHDCVIAPHSHANMILFVPKQAYEETFTITLIDEITGRAVKLVTSTH